MASLGFGVTTLALRRQLFATPTPKALVPRLLGTIRWRPFTNASFRYQEATKSTPNIVVTSPPSVPRPTPRAGAEAKTAGPVPVTQYAFIKMLGTRPTPTVLYEAPSHFWFYFSCWTSGIFILMWSVLSGPYLITQPEGVPSFVGYTFGACYILLACIAFWLIFKTPRVVSRIRLLPALAPPASPTNAAAAANSAPALSIPHIEITVRRMMPFMGSKVLVTGLGGVALKSRFSLPEELVPELRRLPHEREQPMEQPRRFDVLRLLMAPLRYVGNGLLGFFRGVRTAWTGTCFATMRVNGKEYKVDVTRGFALHGFETLERLVYVGYPN